MTFYKRLKNRLTDKMGRVLKVFSLGLFTLFSGQVMANELQVGDVAPDFELQNQHGKQITLSQYQGQWVVLYFYPKDDTPGCTTEACSFRDNINHLIDQNAIILGVSIDNLDSHKAFSDKFTLPFSLLADTDGAVTKEYGALLNLLFMKFAKRHSFIINPKGNIVKIYREVNPETHVMDVLQDLKQFIKSAD